MSTMIGVSFLGFLSVSFRPCHLFLCEVSVIAKYSPSTRPFATDLYDLVDCYFDSKDGADKAEIEARLSMVESNIFESFLFDEGKSKHDELLQVTVLF